MAASSARGVFLAGRSAGRDQGISGAQRGIHGQHRFGGGWLARLGCGVCPALDQMYWGGLGYGAQRVSGGDVASIQVATPETAGAQCRVVASNSHLNAETSALIAQLGATDLVQAGSSLKFCRVAEGQADAYPRLAPTFEWDTAAAQAVLEGAGGQVVDLQGLALRYGKPDVLNPHFIAAAVPLCQLSVYVA